MVSDRADNMKKARRTQTISMTRKPASRNMLFVRCWPSLNKCECNAKRLLGATQQKHKYNLLQ